MKKSDFKKFFKPYAESVDTANEGLFWVLNNRIITKIINLHIPITSSSHKTILDAGGGTGRWICDLAKIYKTKFVLFDLSEDMLKVAENNIKKAKIENRVQIINGDLEDMKSIGDNSVDYITSIYSPISFVTDKNKAIKEIYRILKRGGVIIIMGQGYYNALFSKINNYIAPAEEIRQMDKKAMVRWGSDVPSLHVFTKESLESLLKTGGFNIYQILWCSSFCSAGSGRLWRRGSQ